MENINKTAEFRFQNNISDTDMEYLRTELLKLEGIESVNINTDLIEVQYLTYKLAANAIKETICSLGYDLKSSDEKKGILQKFITRLSNSNKKVYGNKRLDCCDIKRE